MTQQHWTELEGLIDSDSPKSEVIALSVPPDLHPDTRKLVVGFAEALAAKLRAAEQKYGYSNGWKTEDWEQNCRRDLYRHAEKGDPRDVAIYAAFCWARGWSTRPGGIVKLEWR